MSKNKVFLLLAFIIICVFLTGCSVADLFRSKENEEEAEKWREQAEKLAIEHIEQKYGFTPTVKKVQSNQDDSPFINFNYTSESLITMSYADVVFEVVAYGTEETTDYVYDNYQVSEIYEDFSQYLIEYIGIEPYDITLQAGYELYWLETHDITTDYTSKYNFFHDYYDGTNLDALLSFSKIYVKIIGDINIDEATLATAEDILCDLDINFLITSHESEEYADKCNLLDYFDETVYNHAIYITDAIQYEYGEKKEYDISVGQYGDIYYMCSDMDVSDYSITLGQDNFFASEWNNKYGSDPTYARTCDDAYYFFGDFNSNQYFCVFYPNELLGEEATDIPDVKMAISYYDSDAEEYEYEYDFFQETDIDGYRVYHTILEEHDEDISFRLLLREYN